MTLLLRIDWSPDATEVGIVDIAAHTTLATASETHHPATPGHDVDRWLQSAATASRAALDSLAALGPTATDIRMVMVHTSAEGGLIALDANGAPVHDALLGTHADSAPDAAWLVKHAEGGDDGWIDASGVLPTSGSTVALLSWLHRSDPDAWAAMTRCTVPVGLLAERLGARPAIGELDAVGTAVADRRSPREWRTDLLSVVDGGRDWLATMPEIVDAATPIGVLTDDAAAALGLPAGRPLHIGSLLPA